LLFFHIFVALIKNAAMKYTTIIDIAQALGISKSTVSRALRGDKQNVSKETRERILAMDTPAMNWPSICENKARALSV